MQQRIEDDTQIILEGSDLAITELVDIWSHESRQRLGLSRQQWHHPAVRELLTALEAGDTLSRPLRHLGEARGAAGLSLEETLEDLRVLVRILPDRVGIRVDGLEAASLVGTAWAEAFMATITRTGCQDSLTGLSNREFLEARLEQLYRHCHHLGLHPGDAYALVVIDGEPDSASPFARVARRLRLAGDLRASFPGGDTLAVLGDNLLVALVARTPDLQDTVDSLRRCTDSARVTVTGLPEGVPAALALVDDLSIAA